MNNRRQKSENWAKDVADIFLRLVARLSLLLRHPENTALQERFDTFHTELKRALLILRINIGRRR